MGGPEKKLNLPLLNGYVFVRIDLLQSQSILTVNGVVRIVSFDGKPTPIPDEQIHAIQQVLNEDYKIEVIPFCKQGEYIKIIAGPLRGLGGILLRKKSDLSFVVSVEMINRSVAVDINPKLLRSTKDNRNSKNKQF